MAPSIPGYIDESNNKTEGESGRYLEEMLCDGNIEYYRDPESDNSQVFIHSKNPKTLN